VQNSRDTSVGPLWNSPSKDTATKARGIVIPPSTVWMSMILKRCSLVVWLAITLLGSPVTAVEELAFKTVLSVDSFSARD